MTTWTRENDAVIARECEKIPLQWSCKMNDYIYEGKICTKTGHMVWFSIPHYSTDLAACFRAAEAWKNVDIDRRCYSVTSAGNAQPTAMCWISPHSLRGEHIYHGHDEEISAALAWALYNAVKGTK